MGLVVIERDHNVFSPVEYNHMWMELIMQDTCVMLVHKHTNGGDSLKSSTFLTFGWPQNVDIYGLDIVMGLAAIERDHNIF